MADKLTPARRSQNMAAIRSRDTKPEMVVRRLLYGLGYRYRLHKRGLPGQPDLVFSSRRIVIFVHGCFWHSHPDPACLDSRAPKSNKTYWSPKLAGNSARDESNRIKLEADGWTVITVWDCETKDAARLKERLTSMLGPVRA